MKYLIIGGVAGGATVAARLRRLDEAAEIILFERGEYVSYANCGLPYYIGNTIRQREALFLQTPEGFRRRFRIDVRTGQEVTRIDLASRIVSVRRVDSGEEYTESYDKLVLSPGAEPLRPPIPGVDSKRIFTLRHIPDTDRLKTAVTRENARRAVVIGGGFIGLEMAENFRKADMQVTVVEKGNQVMAPLDYSMSAIVRQHLLSNGVGLILEDGVSSFEEGEEGLTVYLESGKQLEADLVLLSIGVRPEVQLAQEAGLALGKAGGIAVNSYMQTSDPDVYALGDAVDVINKVTGLPARIPLAGPANKQGRIVANNLVMGNHEEYKGTIGTSIAKVFDLTVATTGVNAKQLKQAGIPYLSSFIHGKSHAGYYPDAWDLSVKILFSPDNGRLLGAQIVGYDGVDKRMDLMAQVVHNKGTIYDLMEIEHAYAPPYSSAKDPVNMAGYVADNVLSGKVKILHWRDIDPEDTDTLIVDVRTSEECAMGLLPNAIQIPLDELRDRIGELPRDKRILLTCAVGLRGYIAYRILAQHGFENIYNLSGGYRTWSMIQEPPAEDPVVPSVPQGQQQEERSHEPVAIEVDACGLQCPGPVVELNKQYQVLAAGQRLRIRTTDPGFSRDISAWCQMMKAELIEVSQNRGVTEAVIGKPSDTHLHTATCVSGKGGGYGQTIIVFSNDLDKAIAAFILANGAAAAGKKVSLFFTFWGLTILKRREKVAVRKDFLSRMFGWMLPSHSGKLGLSRLHLAGIGAWFMRRVMKRKNVYSLETLIGQAKENGVRMIACTMSMDVMGIREEELMEGVETGGVATYLEQAEKSAINLFI
ncbi:MAG: FAD-dependent oxidoreductase [Bacteroides sp.]|nr:FAD-dependent oxidoreductase [Bacteroides sp.]